MTVAFRIPVEFTNALPTGFARKAVDTLGRWITDDVFTPDAPMPIEDELASSLSVSRATVRDAIKVLSGKGLVRTARRYGTRVLPVDEWNLLDRDVIGWHRSDHPRMRRIFAETTELRVIMEPAAAAIAAERATEAQIRMLLEAAYAIEPQNGDLQALFEADCRFHVTLLGSTRNQVMRQLRQIILTMLRVSYEFGVSRPQNEPVSRQGHIDVAEAIARRDGEAARTAMTEMLERNQSLAAEYWTARDNTALRHLAPSNLQKAPD
jgi:GntR family galactonate operon transcriptional repressor